MTQAAPLPSRRPRTSDLSSRSHDTYHPADGEPMEELRGRHATTNGQGFDRLVTWTILGSIVPGLGLIVAGRRTAGRALLGTVAAAALGAAVFVLLGDPVATARRIATSPSNLLMLAAALAVGAVLWALVVVVTHTSLRRYATLTSAQRGLSTALVLGLVGIGALPALQGSRYALIARDTVQSIFTSDGGTGLPGSDRSVPTAGEDPWAGIGRINVLLIGSDAGKGREGVRPDTLIVASVDTHTGQTVLVSLPRNLQRVPFPAGSPAAAEYPGGFYCYNAAKGANTECLLNAIWTWAEEHPQFYPGKRHVGLLATMEAVQEVTGLKLDRYAMVNLRGFMQFVDAIDGLEIDVKQRLPIGGNVENPVAKAYIEPGRRRLNGYEALWYARSRWSTTDFDRMLRQRCVIAAAAEQADPVAMARNFSKLAAAAKENISTNIGLDELDAWITLAMLVKKSSVRSLAFTNDVISTSKPDFDEMHRLVAAALRPRAATPKPSSTTKPSPRPTPSLPVGSAQAQDVKSVC